MCFSIINSICFYLMLENKGESEKGTLLGRGVGWGDWKENGDIIRLVHETASTNIVCVAICPPPYTIPAPPAPQNSEKSHYNPVCEMVRSN